MTLIKSKKRQFTQANEFQHTHTHKYVHFKPIMKSYLQEEAACENGASVLLNNQRLCTGVPHWVPLIKWINAVWFFFFGMSSCLRCRLHTQCLSQDAGKWCKSTTRTHTRNKNSFFFGCVLPYPVIPTLMHAPPHTPTHTHGPKLS